MKSILPIVISVLLLSGFAVGASAEIINRTVAIVDDDVITLLELNKKIEELTGQKSDEIKNLNENKFIETRREILNLLIDEKLTQDKVHELGIEITQSQIDATIEDIKKTNRITQEELLEGLKSQGITYEKYRDSVKKQLERIRLINYEVKSKILIREEQLMNYYNEHQDKYRKDPGVQIAGIFLKIENSNGENGSEMIEKKGDELIARLKNGEDFETLAKELSQGPGAEEGGDLGRFKTSELAPEMREILDKLREGEISGLIRKGDSVYILKLVKRDEGGLQPFEEVRDSIYETLYNEEVNERYDSWIKNLRENTFTKIIF